MTIIFAAHEVNSRFANDCGTSARDAGEESASPCPLLEYSIARHRGGD
jgi:hypothetical protein